MGKAVDVVWGATGAAVVACALGCDSQPSQPKAGLYEPCAGAGSCAEGSCKDVGVDEFRCAVVCPTQGDCPPLKDGSAAMCLDPWCRSPACDWADGPRIFGFACVDGMLRACGELAAPPCSSCGCNAGTEFCDRATETCMKKKGYGQPCGGLSECQDSSCYSFISAAPDGGPLFDGKSYCMFPLGEPCWPGDPCFCDSGACTASCIDPTMSGSTSCGTNMVCLYQDASRTYGTCRRPCAADPAVCGPDSICADISPMFPGSVYACAAPPGSPRPPRAEGVPCQADGECISGACCHAATGETWGHCASDLGC